MSFPPLKTKPQKNRKFLMHHVFNIEILALILSVVASSSAHMLLKAGASDLKDISLIALFNGWLIGGIFLHFVALTFWVFALRNTDITKAYPFLALGYIFVAVGGALIFGEKLTATSILGMVVICIGIFLVLK